MKKSESGRGVAKTVDEYLSGAGEPARTTLNKMRALIRAAAPAEAAEAISDGVPMFKYKGVLLGGGAFKDHCSLFLATSSIAPGIREELKTYDTSKGTIRFAVDKPLPASLVKRIVKARVAQNEQRGRGSAARKNSL